MNKLKYFNFICISLISLICTIYAFDMYNNVYILYINLPLVILCLFNLKYNFKLKEIILIFEKVFKYYITFISFITFILFINYLYLILSFNKFIFLSFFSVLFISFVLICKNLNVSNKFLCIIKNKNYFSYLQKLMLIKFFFLYVYVLSDYSLCGNTLTKYMHDHLDSDACILAAGTLAFAGTISFVSIKGYQYFEKQREIKDEFIFNELNEINRKLNHNYFEKKLIKSKLITINNFLEESNNSIKNIRVLKSDIDFIKSHAVEFNTNAILIHDKIEKLSKSTVENHNIIKKLCDGIYNLVNSAIKYLIKQDNNIEVIKKEVTEVESVVKKERIEQIDITTVKDLGDFEIMSNNNLKTSRDLIKHIQSLEIKVKSYEEKLNVNLLTPVEQNKLFETHNELKSLLEEDFETKNDMRRLTTDSSVLYNTEFGIKPGALDVHFDHIVYIISYILDQLEENSISYFVALNIIKQITQFEKNPWYLENISSFNDFDNIVLVDDKAQKEFDKKCKNLYFIIKLFMDTYVR